MCAGLVVVGLIVSTWGTKVVAQVVGCAAVWLLVDWRVVVVAVA